MSTKKYKVCSICGAFAGYSKQWWNRDDGYGVCPDCANKQIKKMDADEFKENFGLPGIHFSFSENKMEAVPWFN